MLVCVSFPVPFLIFKLWLYLAIKENEKLLVLMKVHLWVFANLLPVQDYWEILLESRLNCSHFIERTLEIAKLSRPSLCATELEKKSTWAPKLLPERFGVFVYLRKKSFRLQLILSENTGFAIAPYFQVGQLSWMRSNISEEANQICQLGKSDLSVQKSDVLQIFGAANISELENCKDVSRYEFPLLPLRCTYYRWWSLLLFHFFLGSPIMSFALGLLKLYRLAIF